MDQSYKKAKAEISKIINKYGLSYVLDLYPLLGEVAYEHFFSKKGLPNEGLEWMTEYAIGKEIGLMRPRISTLFDWLVENCHTDEDPYDDFNHYEKLAVMKHSDESSVLFYCSEYLSYFVVLTKRIENYLSEGATSLAERDTYDLHIRMITEKPDDRNPRVQEFVGGDVKWIGISDCLWMKDHSSLMNSEYLEHRDFRDRGFVVSAKQNPNTGHFKADGCLNNYRAFKAIITHLSQLIEIPDMD